MGRVMTIARILFALSAASLVAAPAIAGLSRAERGEAKLAKMLDGRVAGESVDCIRDFSQEGMTTVDGVGFVFKRGKTIYVNRPANAAFVDDSDLPVIEKWSGSQLCRLDRVEMRDRITLMHGPVTLLGDFVPYTRVD